MNDKAFAIIGCGRLGTALAVALTRRGYKPVGFCSRNTASASALADMVQQEVVISRNPWDCTPMADIVFITTPDDHIRPVCKSISKNQGLRKDSVYFHCSGSLPSTILADACGGLVATASIHPVQSFSGGRYRSNPFSGITMSVEGDPRAVRAARVIVADLDARVLPISTSGKEHYHAAAVVASNYLVTIADLALSLMSCAAVPQQEALSVLQPLMLGTLKNIAEKGPAMALTGPISRGDLNTIASHLNAIGSRDKNALELYTALARRTVDIAAARQEMDPGVIQKLKELLKAS